MKKIILVFLSILLALVIVFAIANRKTINTVIILNQGSVEQKEYNVQIPFEYELGLIFINVSIDDAEYKFLLDSGSSNVISKELAEKLNLQAEGSNDIEDSQSTSSEVVFTTVDAIKIGELNYVNTGAAIIDLNASDDIACLHIDGLIGANLMKNSIWKIDYQNKMIQLTNTIDSVEIPSGSQKIPMFTELTGSPIIDVFVNQTEERNVVVDLGSNGGFSLAMETYNALLNTDGGIPKISSYGVSSSALRGNDVTDARFYDLYPKKVSFGEVEVANAKISFSENENVSTIGSQFLENFDVILNWNDYEIILVPTKKVNDPNMLSYGFEYGYTNGSIIVKRIIENSNAEKAGLRINDKIIQINDKSLDTVTQEEWCELIRTDLLETENKAMELTIVRDTKPLLFSLTKTSLF